MDQRVTLSIAGFTLQIIDDIPQLPEWLTRACGPFTVAEGTPAASAHTIIIHRNDHFPLGQEDLVYELNREPGSFVIQGFDFVARRQNCVLPIEVETHPDGGMGAFLRWLVNLLLLESGGLLLHAASFASNGSGVVCAGASGRGKTTLSRLVRPSVTLFTDETTAARFIGDAPVMYSTPFAGELGPVSGPVSAPLETLCFLHHAPETALRPMRTAEVVAQLIGCTFLPVRHGAWIETCFTLAERLARAVPCYDLGFAPTTDVLEVIRHVLPQPVSSS